MQQDPNSYLAERLLLEMTPNEILQFAKFQWIEEYNASSRVSPVRGMETRGTHFCGITSDERDPVENLADQFIATTDTESVHRLAALWVEQYYLPYINLHPSELKILARFHLQQYYDMAIREFVTGNVKCSSKAVQCQCLWAMTTRNIRLNIADIEEEVLHAFRNRLGVRRWDIFINGPSNAWLAVAKETKSAMESDMTYLNEWYRPSSLLPPAAPGTLWKGTGQIARHVWEVLPEAVRLNALYVEGSESIEIRCPHGVVRFFSDGFFSDGDGVDVCHAGEFSSPDVFDLLADVLSVISGVAISARDFDVKS